MTNNNDALGILIAILVVFLLVFIGIAFYEIGARSQLQVVMQTWPECFNLPKP